MMTGVSSAGGGLIAVGNALTNFVMGDILAAAPVNAYSFDIIAPNLARYTDFIGNMVYKRCNTIYCLRRRNVIRSNNNI
jgi:hypothetical protein